jgi:hypothetical protein
MTPTRREFIREFGIILASFIAAGCVPRTTPTATLAPTSTAPGSGDGSPRERLRSCWLGFEWLSSEVREDWEQGNRAMHRMTSNHRTALNKLIAAGEISTAVADEVQMAFEEGAYDALRRPSLTSMSSGPSCYLPSPLGMKAMGVRGDLVHRAEILSKMAEGGEMSPDAVANAQAAVARDIAFFDAVAALQSKGDWEAEEDILEQLETSGVETSPEAIEAAKFLVDLLLGATE